MDTTNGTHCRKISRLALQVVILSLSSAQLSAFSYGADVAYRSVFSNKSQKSARFRSNIPSYELYLKSTNEDSLSLDRPSDCKDSLSEQESAKKKSDNDVGGYDPSEGIQPEREVNVGDPQIKVKEKERSVTSILRELAAIQQQGPQKYCILGTRHCSYLHQQIIELL